MTRGAVNVIAVWLGVLATAGSSLASDSPGEYPMPAGDAVTRRTDSTNSGALLADQGLPDLIHVSAQRWAPVDPVNDPYTGVVVSSGSASVGVFRLQLTFAGVVNPPGTLGLYGNPFDPTAFGKSPVYGFVEVDVDDEKDTGGESVYTAALRPLGQASRFGGRFYGSIGDRQAESAGDLNQAWTNEPQIARTGADWVLSLCGCFGTTVEFKSDPGATAFGPGQTWIVSGRFFQRSGGYRPASLVTGGSVVGAYDPVVRLRFAHDVPSNTTTVTLVHALTQAGAALLAGEPVQAVNTSVADHTSIEEGVADLIASSTRPGLSGLTQVLITDWNGASVSNSLSPRQWNVRALLGTAYPNLEDALYVWTDIGPGLLRGDVSGNAQRTSVDRTAILHEIATLDGGAEDGDGLVNATVQIIAFGGAFNLHDVNADGLIDDLDLAGLPICAADYNASATVTIQDVFDFLTAWFNGNADFNNSGTTTVQDLFDFVTAWFAGC